MEITALLSGRAVSPRPGEADTCDGRYIGWLLPACYNTDIEDLYLVIEGIILIYCN